MKARKFAKSMKAAALVFISAEEKINLQKLFVVAFAKIFDLKCTVGLVQGAGEAIIEYDRPHINPKSLEILCLRRLKQSLATQDDEPGKHSLKPGDLDVLPSALKRKL